MSGNAKLIGLILALAGFVIIPFLFFGDQLEQMFTGSGAISILQNYGNYAWIVAIGLLIADLAFPIPTTSVMAALGMIYGPALGGVIASVGSIISGLFGYFLCRHMGRPFVIWMNGEQAVTKGEQIFGNIGGWLVALSRWVPVLSEIIACMAGLSRMSFPVFFIALLCGSIPLGFLYSTIGYLGGDRPVLTLVLSAILPFGLWLVARPFLRTS